MCIYCLYVYVYCVYECVYVYIMFKMISLLKCFLFFYILSFFTLVCLCVLHACECGSMWKPEVDVEINLVFFPTLLFEAGFFN